MNRNCTACDIMIDINNYKKDRTVCKTCYNKKKEKTILTHYPQRKLILPANNQKLKMLTIIFQHMKTIVMLLLVRAMLVKPITCSKY